MKDNKKLAKKIWKAVREDLEGRSGFDFMGDFDAEIEKEFQEDLIKVVENVLDKDSK